MLYSSIAVWTHRKITFFTLLKVIHYIKDTCFTNNFKLRILNFDVWVSRIQNSSYAPISSTTYPGKQQVMAQMVGSQPLTWKIWIGFPIPSFGLAQLHPFKTFVGAKARAVCQKFLSPCVCHCLYLSAS